MDSQYIIDIAAQISGGAASLAQLDQLAGQLTGMGAKAAVFDDAMIQLNQQIKAAAAASDEATNALAAGRDEFAQLERAAVNAQKAFERASLKGPVAADVAANVESTAAAVQEYAEKLTGLESAASAASAKHEQLTGALSGVKDLNNKVNRSFTEQAERTAKVQGALGMMGGPLGRLGQQAMGPVTAFRNLSTAIGSSSAAAVVAVVGFVAIAVAVAALAAAAVAGFAAFAVGAIKLADAGRSAQLAAQAFDAANPALAGLRGEIDDLTGSTGLAAGDLQGLATSLKDARISAGQMPAALRAAATAEAALGKGGAAKYIEQLKAGKLTVKEFAATAERSFGGIVAKQMLGLSAQGATLKRNWAGLFSGLNIEPVLNGLSTLVGLVDKNSESGRFLKAVFEGVLQPLIDQAQNAAYVVEAFVLGAMIGMVKLYIALKPTIKAIADLFDLGGDWTLADTLNAAKDAGELLAPVFVVVVAAAGLLAAGVLGLVAAFGAVLAIPAALGAMAGAVLGIFASLLSKAVELGSGLIGGLVGGITGGAGQVVAAVTGAVGGAINAAKRMLGIASPSKVFAAIGDQTVAGFTGAVEGGAPDARTAIETMVEPPAAKTAPGAGTARAAAGGGNSVSFAGAIFNFGPGTDGKQAARDFAETLTLIFEGDAEAVAGLAGA